MLVYYVMLLSVLDDCNTLFKWLYLMLMIIVIAYIIVWCTKYVAQVYEIHEEDFCVMHLHKSDKAGTAFFAKDVTDKYGVVV